MATKSKLKVGDTVTVKDRLWAVVGPNGRLSWFDDADHAPIFRTRAGAVADRGEGERIIRLRDIVGDVVR